MTPQEEIASLGDIPIEIEVELDRRVMTTREVLRLEEGSIIATTRSAGENIDIYIGGVLCGSGEGGWRMPAPGSDFTPSAPGTRRGGSPGCKRMAES